MNNQNVEDKYPEIVEIKDLTSGSIYPMTMMSEEIEEELKKYGLIDHYLYKDSLLYHINLNLTDYYKTDRTVYTISFVKGLYSYGYDHDLWEAAIMKRIKSGIGKIRGVKGNLTDREVLEYTKEIYSQLKNDLSYFDNLPLEFNQYE